MKPCTLCGLRPAIRNSHIVPKFVVRTLKEGTPHQTLRHSNDLGRVAQDGWKGEYLCLDCENTFSKWENRFAREVYNPYLQGTRTSFPMSAELALFVASVHFRYVNHALEINRVVDAPPDVANLREILRRVCLEGSVPAGGLHMYLEFEPLITDPAVGFPAGINAYLSDALDGSLFQCLLPGVGMERVNFVKFPSMLLFCSTAPLVESADGTPVPMEIKTTGLLDSGTHDHVLLAWIHEQTLARARDIQASYPLLPEKQHAKNVAKIQAAPNIERYRAHRAYLADQELHERWTALQTAAPARDGLPPAPTMPNEDDAA